MWGHPECQNPTLLKGSLPTIGWIPPVAINSIQHNSTTTATCPELAAVFGRFLVAMTPLSEEGYASHHKSYSPIRCNRFCSTESKFLKTCASIIGLLRNYLEQRNPWSFFANASGHLGGCSSAPQALQESPAPGHPVAVLPSIFDRERRHLESIDLDSK